MNQHQVSPRHADYTGWRNELYQIYHPPTSTAPSLFPSRSPDAPVGGTMFNKAFTLERAACAIFGVATFGVHLHAYEGEGDEMKVWVPRRAKSKATYPGLLDSVSHPLTLSRRVDWARGADA